MSPLVILTSFLLLLTTQVTAVTCTVTNNAANTAGGIRFTNEIGSTYARQTLSSATDFVWKTFQQTNPAERKNTVEQVSLIVEVREGTAENYNTQIHLSAGYVQSYSGNVKAEVTGILYHEVTHMWMWNDHGQAPKGLIEGIADYVRLKAGYAPSHWIKAGQGDKWDHGYDVTARFLDYCNSLRNGFVAELNKKMKDGYNDSYFSDLLGKSVDQLWNDYKAKFNN